MIAFKHGTDQAAWPEADPRLLGLVQLAALFLHRHYSIDRITVTSFFRGEQLASAHAHYRAADVRVRDLPPGAARAVTSWLNALLAYSDAPGKAHLRCAIFGEVDPEGRHQDHIHMQVPPPGEMLHMRQQRSSLIP